MLCIGANLAIIIKTGEKDVFFVYLDRHVPGTAKYEMWSTNKESVRMNVVSSA